MLLLLAGFALAQATVASPPQADARPPEAAPPTISAESVELSRLDVSEPRVFIGVGEIHGTAEAPAVVEALAKKLKASGYSVVLYLEEPRERSPFFQYRDGTRAARALAQSPFWSDSFQDGRRGLANACVRWRLRPSKSGIEFVQVDPGVFDATRGYAMAKRIAEDLGNRRGRRVAGIFWAGNAHVLDGPPALPPPAFRTAAMALPTFRSITLDIYPARGSSYRCLREGCGNHPVPALATARPGLARGNTSAWSFVIDRATPQYPAVSYLKSGSNLQAVCEAQGFGRGGPAR